MSQETGLIDPRSNIDYPLDTGRVYKDERTGDELVLVFLSEDAALLRDGDYHRLETREQFEENVGSGRYDLQANVDESATASAKVRKLNRLLERYEERDGRKADHKASAIEEALDLIENNGRPDDNDVIEFDAIDGIGEGAAQKLVAHGFRTKGDVRSAEREEIEDVPLMGESNTTNLIEYVA